MNYYEVVVNNIDANEKERYLVKASSTSQAEKKTIKRLPYDVEVISIKLTKYNNVIKGKK